jgi:hypothetical protein
MHIHHCLRRLRGHEHHPTLRVTTYVDLRYREVLDRCELGEVTLEVLEGVILRGH